MDNSTTNIQHEADKGSKSIQMELETNLDVNRSKVEACTAKRSRRWGAKVQKKVAWVVGGIRIKRSSGCEAEGSEGRSR